MTSLLDAAVAYAEAGMAVFPLQPREKKPYGFTNGLDAASATPGLAAARWEGRAALPLRPKKTEGERMPTVVMARPGSNVGIATGRVSGFWVFDIDGPEGAASLAVLEKGFGPLPVTAEQSTGKGRHICFAWPPAEAMAGRELRNSAGKIGEGIDTRGDGGYIVAAPSIHPSGRVYEWAEGRSPWQCGFAQAPAWLLDLVAPVKADAAPAGVPRPLAARIRDGRASPYGEAVLDRACKDIAGARPGTRDETLYDKSVLVGCYVAGGEIERAYARDALVGAVLAMPDPYSRAVAETKVDRALTYAEGHAKTAPEPQRRGAAGPLGRQGEDRTPAAQKAAALGAAEALWTSARPAWTMETAAWLRARGLDPRPEANDELLRALRYHPAAPWGRGGRTGPALLGRLSRGIADDGIEGVAVLPLHPDCERFVHFLGESSGRAVLLGELGGALLVTIDLQDAWALAMAGHDGLIAVVPRLSSFAGGALGDTWGRVSPDLPRADPARPAWTIEGPPKAILAVRRDLRSPPLRVRGPGGKSREVILEGEAAARFFGSLAEQHWRASGCPAVRVIGPRSAGGFNDHQRGGAE